MLNGFERVVVFVLVVLVGLGAWLLLEVIDDIDAAERRYRGDDSNKEE